MAGMGALAGEHFAAPRKVCGAADLSAVLVKTEEQVPVFSKARIISARVLTAVALFQYSGNLHGSPGHARLRRVPLEPSDALLLSTILRI